MALHNRYTIFNGHRIIILVVLCLSGLFLSAAVRDGKKGAKAPSKDDERVYLIHSDEMLYDVYGDNPDAQIVKGNVKFLHKGGYLTCDSAYFYQQQNAVRAMGHVHYKEGDTLSLVCERGFYDGEMKMMEARSNVVLKHRRQTLYTDSLNYDAQWKEAYFYDGGKLVDGKQQLRADWGTYNTETKKAIFYYKVVMLTDKQRVETDTLHYDTDESVAHVIGPSVVYQDSSVVHTTDGFFYKDSNKSQLYGRSTVDNGTKTITGDSLYYDKETGEAEGFGGVIFVDKENKNELHGDYVRYNETTGEGFATKRALVKDYSQSDTLFVHSDTIKLYTFNINTDSVYRKVHCFKGVRAYRVDMQAVCDSMVGDSRDSCMVMYGDPIVWNGMRQVTGDLIKVYAADSTIREANIIGNSLSIEKCDEDGHYNQISSKQMNVYFTEGVLRRVLADGNVKLIFYPIDDADSTLMLLNYTETDTLKMNFTAERKLERVWTSKHVSDMYPMTQIPPEKYKLPQFVWTEEKRPRSKDDIYGDINKEDDNDDEADALPASQDAVPQGEEPAAHEEE